MGTEKMARKKKTFVAVNKRSVERIKKKPAFVPRHAPKVGAEIYRFRRPGQSIEGFLGGQVAYHQAQNTYLFVQADKDGYTLLEIPGNQHLARTIKRYDLVGHYVKITYEGNLPTAHGHYRKIYTVEKLAHYSTGFLDGYKQCLKKAQENGRRLSAPTVKGPLSE